jgi:threonine/homoserine/homoserine lactone efflux protein
VFVLTRVLSNGRRAGLASLIGVATGNAGNVLASSFGLAWIFKTFPGSFEAVKVAGVAYLIYLGVRALRRSSNVDEVLSAPPPTRLLREAFWVALLNPKTTLFFAAFLPQFVVPPNDIHLQSLILGMVFVGIAGLVDLFFVLFASLLFPHISNGASSSTVRYVTCGSFFILAIFCLLGK